VQEVGDVHSHLHVDPLLLVANAPVEQLQVKAVVSDPLPNRVLIWRPGSVEYWDVSESSGVLLRDYVQEFPPVNLV